MSEVTHEQIGKLAKLIADCAKILDIELEKQTELLQEQNKLLEALVDRLGGS